MAKKSLSIDEVWSLIQGPFSTVLIDVGHGMTSANYMSYYSTVFNFVSSMNADNAELYKRVVLLLQKRAAELVQEGSKLPDELLLTFFVKKWEDWAAATKLLNQFLAYLNRTYVKTQRSTANASTSNVYEISMLGDVTWRDNMLVPMKEKLTDAMIRLITSEREGNTINFSLVKSCLGCFLRMGLNKANPQEPTTEVYKEHFEGKFLAMTEAFYTVESQRVLHDAGVSFYMKKVVGRMKEEEERVTRYMHQITLKPLTAKLEQVLVGAHKEALQGKFLDFLKEDVTDFTKTDTNDDLKISYSLLKRVEGALDPLKATLEQFIKGVGLQQLEAEKKEAAEKPDAFVNIILRVFRKYTELNNVAFHNDSGFVAALDKAFREFVNKNAVTDQEIPGMDKGIAKAPQILAKFCDAILKRGPTFISDEAEMERTQTDIVSLFKYFPDKDVFMLVYSKLLSKRLIQDLSASEDAEASMINKLKSAQGFEYCMKLQRMMTDMQLCKGMNKDFQEFCETAKSVLPFSFNLYVLATGSWPLQTIMSNFQPPAVVRSAIDQFKVFYDKKYQGRKLSYLHHMSRAEVDMRPNIKGKKFILQTTTYQMGALMLFADTLSIKLRDILAQTQLQEVVVKQNLIPLVKLKILTVTADGGPAPDTWNENTVFSVNQKFAFKKLRVNCVPGPIVVRTAADKELEKIIGGPDANKEEVMNDRVLKLQAAIVRIMKARKSFSHTELVQETISQVARWFSPEVPHIKKAIESLIDQEYIKRVESSPSKASVYEYIA